MPKKQKKKKKQTRKKRKTQKKKSKNHVKRFKKYIGTEVKIAKRGVQKASVKPRMQQRTMRYAVTSPTGKIVHQYAETKIQAEIIEDRLEARGKDVRVKKLRKSVKMNFKII